MKLDTSTSTESRVFVRLEQIHTIQIDHNSTCNLNCPQCARTVDGKLNPGLPQSFLPTSFYQNVFSPDLCSQIERVFFCGNYGDVIASPNFLEVCRHLKKSGLHSLGIVTNGSLRDPDWWAELADILDPKTDRVSFSIDGLADTNAIYRVGSRFEKIMENAEAYLRSGGRARWEYLAFAHNEHQIEEAKKLAQQMGFESFKLKKTNRFINDKNYKTGKSEKSFPLLGRAKKYADSLFVPKNKSLQTKSMGRFDQIIEKYGSWDKYIEATGIKCKAQGERTVFIDFEGKLWPCTWLAAPIYFHGDNNFQKKQISTIIGNYGNTFNSLYEHSLEQVLTHPWFYDELVRSWSGSLADKVPKMMTCGRTCGYEYEFSSNAEENKELVRF